ncbi:MAG: hypothetical protein KGD60_08810 [Candidatus Thorarchaeota archaeon]|nr:hypothetical protein [Candidatus Thorarchaeota archaeon]
MPENRKDIFNSIRLERNISYPFPTIVSIVSIFIIVAAYSILGIGRYNMSFYLSPGWNSTAITEKLVESVNTVSSRAIAFPILDFVYVVVLLVPLLIAFNLAQGYSNGQMRTLLSYPIRRRTVLLLKSGLVILLVSSSGTLGVLFSLLYFFPFSISLNSFLILIATFWISVSLIASTCTLLAVVSRSARITAFVGMGLWMVALSDLSMPYTHPLLRYPLFPIQVAVSYIDSSVSVFFREQTTLFDVIFGSGSALILSVALLILSVFIFKRQEI